ncbi:MAG: hypothetical protein EXR91_08850 [Gemmatimonadetes bacterium]|nr:hypothetical protein [Gemmatimonadota bacterium]
MPIRDGARFRAGRHRPTFEGHVASRRVRPHNALRDRFSGPSALRRPRGVRRGRGRGAGHGPGRPRRVRRVRLGRGFPRGDAR